jgi:hypothetical protein
MKLLSIQLSLASCYLPPLTAKHSAYHPVLKHICHRSEVTAVKISMFVFWIVMPHGLVGIYTHFWGTYCLHLMKAEVTCSMVNFMFPACLQGKFLVGTQWIGGWVSPRTSWDAMAKRNIHGHAVMKPHHPACEQSVQWLRCCSTREQAHKHELSLMLKFKTKDLLY